LLADAENSTSLFQGCRRVWTVNPDKAGFTERCQSEGAAASQVVERNDEPRGGGKIETSTVGLPVLRRTLDICRSSSSANGALLVASTLSAMGRSSCAAALAAVTCAGRVG